MKELMIDLKDYNENGSIQSRTAVRGIIIRDNLCLVIHSQYGDYKFPGGGQEIGESNIETLIREVQEETGYRVKSDTIQPYIKVIERRAGYKDSNTIMVMDSYYYFCDVKDQMFDRNLDEYEKEYDYQVAWLPMSEIIKRNEMVENTEKIPWIQREIMVFKELEKEGSF